MSLVHTALGELEAARDFFNRSTGLLTEAHSQFAPVPGMMTAAQQVAHCAHTVDWFVEGAFRPEGFDMDFEAHARIISGVTSLEKAREWFEKSIADAKARVATLSNEELLAPMAPGPIMGGLPRMAIFGAITDHTAHHRGALSVYTRLNNLVPPMPYM